MDIVLAIMLGSIAALCVYAIYRYINEKRSIAIFRTVFAKKLSSNIDRTLRSTDYNKRIEELIETIIAEAPSTIGASGASQTQDGLVLTPVNRSLGKELPYILMPAVISAAILGSALFVILSGKYDDASAKWAFGAVGLVSGFWLNTKK